MIQMWANAPQDLQLLKLDIIEATGLGKDALHIYAGLAVFVAVRLAWRWRGGWFLAWVAALCLAAGIEWLDMRVDAVDSVLDPGADHWHDLWNTMFWPTMLLFFGRWLQPAIKPAPQPESSDLADQSFKEPPAV